MRKRLLTMLLVLAMVLTFAPGLAMAAEGAASTFADVKATLENGGAITEPVAVELSNAGGVHEYVLGSATNPLGDVDISNVTFTSVDDEESGEDCALVIHTTGKVTGADTCGVEVTVVTYVAKAGDTYYETLAKAVAADAEEIVVELLGDAIYDVAAWENSAMGGENTKTITINGNEHTLTFNHTNSDWNNVATKGAKLVINNAKITNSGYNNSAWNRHDINFECDIELNNVTSDKALAFKSNATLNTVTITEDYTSDVYGIWIQAKGQTVSLTNVTIDTTAATDGRGIAINDEYVTDTCAKVTLKADGLTIKSEEKGAIMVKSTAGADITLSNVNIENTIDPVYAVWVDEDRANAKVTVTGASMKLEGAVAVVDGVYYNTLEAAVAEGGEVMLLDEVELTKVVIIDKDVTINGNNHKVTSSVNRVFRVTKSNLTVEMNDLNMESTAFSSYTSDVRGISLDTDISNVSLVLNNCSVAFTPMSKTDWAYAVNVCANSSEHSVIINGGTYEGANVINIHGDDHTVEIYGATLNCAYGYNAMYYGQCVCLEGSGVKLTVENTIFNGTHAVAISEKTEGANTIAQNGNADNTSLSYDAVVNGYYGTLAEVIAKADDGDTVTLNRDVEISSQLVIDKDINLDGAGYKIIALPSNAANYGEYSSYMISVSADVTVKDLIIDGGEAKVMGIQFYACEGVLENVTIQNVTRYYPVHVNAANVKIVGELEVINNDESYVPLVAVGYGKNLPEGSKSALTMEADASIVGAAVYFVAEDQANVAATKGSMTATVTEDTSVVGAVAKIGNVHYASLEAAVAAGGEVKLLAEVELTESLKISAGKTVVLDLAGYTISYTKAETVTGNHYLIENKGILTVKDSSATEESAGTGKIIFNYTGSAVQHSVSTIGNIQGTVTILSGTIENETTFNNPASGPWGYGIDSQTNSIYGPAATLTISGGTVKAVYTAVRQCIQGNQELNTLTITGGEIISSGRHAIQVNDNNDDSGETLNNAAVLNISGGTITSSAAGSNALRVSGASENISVSGGTFNGEIVNKGINVGTVTEGCITGGTFSKDPTAFVADGYVVSYATNDEGQKVYTVAEQKDAVEDPETNTAFGAGESTGGVNETVTEISGKDVLDAANSEDTSDSLVDAAQNVVTVTEDIKKEANETAKEVFGEDAVTEQTPVVVEVRAYLEVLVNEVDMNEQTMTVEIEALYNTVAVVGNREVTFGEPEPMDTVGQAITITLPIPADFADASYIYVNHIKKDDKGDVVATYTYEATVSEVGGKFYVTFVNPHGFSEFNVITSETEMEVHKDCLLGHTYDDNLDGICNVCKKNREVLENRIMKDMFRMYNPYSGEHFYTGSEVERDNLVAAGWHYEGVAFTFPTNTGAPVHRLYHEPTGEHIYTMDEAEKDRLLDEGWNYENVAFNSAYNTEAVQYRLYNPYATVGAYHFTHSEEEKQDLIDAGWEYQGIGWYSCFG